MFKKRYNETPLAESDFQKIIREISWDKATAVNRGGKQRIVQHGGQALELSKSEPTPAGVHVIPPCEAA